MNKVVTTETSFYGRDTVTYCPIELDDWNDLVSKKQPKVWWKTVLKVIAPIAVGAMLSYIITTDTTTYVHDLFLILFIVVTSIIEITEMNSNVLLYDKIDFIGKKVNDVFSSCEANIDFDDEWI